MVSSFSLIAYGMDQTTQPSILNETNATIDARIFLKDRPYNKQDAQGNTFLHQVALISHRFSEWKDISQKMNQFAEKNNGNMPNPLIENLDNTTARKLAKAQFKQHGNPISGTLTLFLQEAEYIYLDRCSSEEGRIELSKK
jgi:hypothetical protein